MFELRRLRLLNEFAVRGTIAEVAAGLAYSPSTVSQQLSLLEREAGVTLLEPDGRRMRLTAHGRLLAEHAARMLELDEQAREALASSELGQATVRIASMQTAAEAILPGVLTTLAASTPALRIEISVLPPEIGLFELSARRFDLVIAEQYPGHTRERHGGVIHKPLGDDPIRLVRESGAPVTALASLADRPWVMEPEGTAARQWAVQQCRAAGFEPDVRFEAADLAAHARLIATGHAVGMLPDLVWTNGRPPLTLSALPGDPSREVFMAIRAASQDNPAIQLVRTALQEAFIRHQRSATLER